ncbi:MAG: hypothetical protein EXS39_01560 [Opitutaceae bacterium]|nr:hypothetical protein [Opitutaceae bacterium]
MDPELDALKADFFQILRSQVPEEETYFTRTEADELKEKISRLEELLEGERVPKTGPGGMLVRSVG